VKRFVDRIGVPGLGLGSIRLLNAEHGRVEIPLETPSKMPSKNAPKKMPSKNSFKIYRNLAGDLEK
jgi:hypothetical protein